MSSLFISKNSSKYKRSLNILDLHLTEILEKITICEFNIPIICYILEELNSDGMTPKGKHKIESMRAFTMEFLPEVCFPTKYLIHYFNIYDIFTNS